MDETTVNLGYRESEEDEASLSVVFDSLLPFIHDQKSSIPVPVYLGQVVYEDTYGG